MTLHQGAIEQIFKDSLREHGVHVERPYQPTSLELSQDEKELLDPEAYPVKVCFFPSSIIDRSDS